MSTCSRLLGTFRRAAVPVAPTPGGKPYSSTAIRRSDTGLRRRSTHLQEQGPTAAAKDGVRTYHQLSYDHVSLLHSHVVPMLRRVCKVVAAATRRGEGVRKPGLIEEWNALLFNDVFIVVA